MPIQYTPFSTPSTQIGAGINNMAQAMFSGPTALEAEDARSRIDYRRALMDAAKSEAASKAAAAGARGQLADVVTRAFGPAPAAPGDLLTGVPAPSMTPDQHVRTSLPDVAGALVRADQLGEMGNVMRALTAMAPGTSDQLVSRALTAAGQPLSENQAVDLDDRERVSQRNSNQRMNEEAFKIGATPLTRDQVLGQMLMKMWERGAISPRGEQVLIGTQDKPNMQPYAPAGGGPTILFDANDPLAAGQPLPIQVETPGGGTDTMAATLGNKIGTAADDPMTTSRRTRASEAESLGLSLEEYDFVKLAQSAIAGNPLGVRALTPEEQETYKRIIAKANARLGGVEAQPLPPGFEIQ